MAAQHKLQPAGIAAETAEQAYYRYRAELRRFFESQLREPQSVDDLMQTLCERLLRYPPAGVLREPHRYLFRIAWRVLNEANRRIQREQSQMMMCDAQELEALAEQFGVLWVESESEASLTEQHLERILRELPNVCQIALLRQRRDGLSYKEIAQELGVSVHTVKKYIVRALDHFRLHFQMGRRPDSR